MPSKATCRAYTAGESQLESQRRSAAIHRRWGGLGDLALLKCRRRPGRCIGIVCCRRAAAAAAARTTCCRRLGWWCRRRPKRAKRRAGGGRGGAKRPKPAALLRLCLLLRLPAK